MTPLSGAAFVLLYVGYIFIGTFYPFEWSEAASFPSFEVFRLLHGERLVSKDFLLNVLIFFPCGVLFYCSLGFRGRSKPARILIAVLCSTCISFIIELFQVFLTRSPQATDLLSNTIGAALGAAFIAAWPPAFAAYASQLWTRLERSPIILCAAVLLAVTPLTLSLVQFVSPFHIWDSRFTFQIGNEATLDKPWLGKIYLVALYNRALPSDEVANNFRRGLHSATSTNAASEGLIALYTFSERRGNTVHDVSGFKEPLDLIISFQDRIRWLESSDGLEILQPAILQSQQPGIKLASAIGASSELSIEVWLTPDNTVQGGPARIVSLAADPVRRNFTLGQEKADIEFRVRTPVVITNRSPLVLRSENALTTLTRSHVVVTYKDSVERSYLNGKSQSEVVELTKEGIVGFGTRKTAVAQVAYGFFYFFPVSFVLSRFLSHRPSASRNRLLISSAVALGLLTASEAFQAIVFNRAADMQLLGFGFVIVTSGALIGEAVQRRDSYPGVKPGAQAYQR